MLEDMQDKREVWHVVGSKMGITSLKEGELVVALVPTSGVGYEQRGALEVSQPA